MLLNITSDTDRAMKGFVNFLIERILLCQACLTFRYRYQRDREMFRNEVELCRKQGTGEGIYICLSETIFLNPTNDLSSGALSIFILKEPNLVCFQQK